MAGSYSHIQEGMSFVENMRDARETIEELFFLVRFFAPDDPAIDDALDQFYAMSKGESPTKAQKAFSETGEVMGK